MNLPRDFNPALIGLAVALACGTAAQAQTAGNAITEPLRWRGEFVYLADAANFTDCASGLRWPVAMAGDYLAAERRYTQTRSAPGAPLVVSFDGRLEVRAAMEGPPREHIVVDRFGGAEPGARCNTPAVAQGTAAVASAPLEDTDWKLVELDGKAIVTAPAQQREVRMTLASAGSRVSGFSGCNPFVGGYEREGAALRFKPLAGTRMACIPPLMELEVQVLKMLGTTSGYRIEGQRLMLLSGEQVHARFDAVRPGSATIGR